MPSLQHAVINGEAVYYADSGGENLPTVLFINSLGTDWRSWRQVASLLPQFRVILYDKRGHGRSPLATPSRTVEQHAGDAHLLLSQLGIHPQAAPAPVVCGVSIGGLIAPHLALLRPLRGLILCNSGLRLGDKETWNARIAAVRAGGMEAIADTTLQRWFAPRYKREHGGEMPSWRAMLVATPAAGYIASCCAVRDADNSSVAKRVKIPVLCVAGADDTAAPPATVRTLCDSFATARYREIADCGHLPNIEHPATLAVMIKSFIEELP